MRAIRIRPEAEADLQHARDWYDRQRDGLGAEFLDESERAIRRIATNPELFGCVHKDARRVKLRRFPYVVYYRVAVDYVEILGVIHGHRDPRVWKRRV